ncbi:MAG TPA: hypothetical protein VKZ51_00170, partial [Cyclobacteriaceae bacterium]|nr:hypothetical protein [Cyclobacteriaceae bacterium]
MRKILSLIFCIPLVFLLGACQEYLDQTPEAEVSEENIFGTYIDFQGFLDPNYPEIIDYAQLYLWNDFNMGGDVIPRSGGTNAYRSAQGDYMAIIGPGPTSIFWNNRQ